MSEEIRILHLILIYLHRNKLKLKEENNYSKILLAFKFGYVFVSIFLSNVFKFLLRID